VKQAMKTLVICASPLPLPSMNGAIGVGGPTVELIPGKKPYTTLFAFLLVLFVLACVLSHAAAAAEVHVSPAGDDANPGTKDRPLATFSGAQQRARNQPGSTVIFHAGVFHLAQTMVLTEADAGTTFAAAADEEVVLSGGMRLDMQWQPHRDGVLKAATPAGLSIDQLFVNGRRQRMARYPNYDPDVRPYGGYAADAFSRERATRWANPAGGYIHAMHRAHWGGYHYRITGKNDEGEVVYEGGWQNNRQMGMHKDHRYVENIVEELDAPGEWFHDAGASTLYYRPSENTDMATATVEVVRLRHLVEFSGTKHVTLRGFIFRHAARTFMDTKEPLLRSDWTIYRGGAVLFIRTEDCTVEDCEFDQLGGNAIFVNNYNRRLRIVGCDIHDTGGSAIAFVGDPQAVRNPLFEYSQRQAYADIDLTPGPKTDNYPADCVVEDCLIRHVGVVEKQATGVQISMAQGITLRHCSIYDTSRAGINVSEGTFGGHVIEFCDVFDTVRETGDHGSFNSWGRDRFWQLKDAPAEELPSLAMLDVVRPNIIRNSRWRCDHGWDVDLDDGSSNYDIYNNVFLHGGLKLREGFRRRVWNNIAINNSLHPHVWYDNSGDVVTGNIWMGAYRPAVMRGGRWGQEVDRNLFTTTDADRGKFAAHGCDGHSLVGDPLFVDPANGDYRVRDGSPALELGFKNFPMDRFGVQRPRLRKIARTPALPSLSQPPGVDTAKANEVVVRHWQGARVKDLTGDEFSAFGVAKDSGGVHVVAGSVGDIQAGDLIQSLNGQGVRTCADLVRLQNAAAGQPLSIGIVRGQQPRTVRLTTYTFVAAETGAPAVGVPLRAVSTRPATSNMPVATLWDGRLAADYGPVFGNGVVGGVYKVDLGAAVTVSAVTTWSYNQNGNRAAQRFALFGSNAETDPGWDSSGLTPIAEVDTTGQPVGRFAGTSIRRTAGQPLGRFRWLLWVTRPVTGGGENTAFQELVVHGSP